MIAPRHGGTADATSSDRDADPRKRPVALHPYFEEAAHLLRLMTAAGLIVRADADYRILIGKLAEHFLQLGKRRSSHADAALSALCELESSGMVLSDCRRRSKMLAVTATVLGNFETMARRVNG